MLKYMGNNSAAADDASTIGYYINLDKRTDRREFMEGQFSSIKSIKLNRFAALEGKPSWVYCGYSHQKVLRDHMDGGDNILIMEDDCLIRDIDNFDDRWSKIKRWLDSNGDKWDLFLGATMEFGKIDNVKVINEELSLIGLDGGMLAHFVYCNAKYISARLKWDPCSKVQFDIFNVLDPNIRIIVSLPFLAHQLPLYSDLSNCNLNLIDLMDYTENFIRDILNQDCITRAHMVLLFKKPDGSVYENMEGEVGGDGTDYDKIVERIKSSSEYKIKNELYHKLNSMYLSILNRKIHYLEAAAYIAAIHNNKAEFESIRDIIKEGDESKRLMG
jgi:hypothetical protein